MTDMEINIGLQVTKQTPVNKGDFKQLIFALGETVGRKICVFSRQMAPVCVFVRGLYPDEQCPATARSTREDV